MKKYLIFCIISIVFLLALPAYAVKKIEANPINIAYMLSQDNDTARMASTCNYYGYVRQTSYDGYTVFKHANGSVIQYKFINSDHKYPTIEVKSKVSSKEKDKILKNLNFQKNGNAYMRKSALTTTRCTTGPHGFLVLKRQPNKKSE